MNSPYENISGGRTFSFPQLEREYFPSDNTQRFMQRQEMVDNAMNGYSFANSGYTSPMNTTVSKMSFNNMEGFIPRGQSQSALEKLNSLREAFEASKYDNVKGSTRAIFNEAYGLAKSLGLKTFWDGTKAVDYNEPNRSQATVTNVSKAEHSEMQGDNVPMPFEYTPKLFNYAEPLNTLPIPEDVIERQAIGNAGEGVAQGIGYATLAGNIGRLLTKGAINGVAKLAGTASGDYEMMMMNRATNNLANSINFQKLNNGSKLRELIGLNW